MTASELNFFSGYFDTFDLILEWTLFLEFEIPALGVPVLNFSPSLASNLSTFLYLRSAIIGIIEAVMEKPCSLSWNEDPEMGHDEHINNLIFFEVMR